MLIMLARPALGAVPGPPRASRLAVGMCALPLGFYEGMLGSGISLASGLLFCLGRGYDLIRAPGHYYVLAFVWGAFAATGYIGHGDHDLGLKLLLRF